MIKLIAFFLLMKSVILAGQKTAIPIASQIAPVSGGISEGVSTSLVNAFHNHTSALVSAAFSSRKKIQPASFNITTKIFLL